MLTTSRGFRALIIAVRPKKLRFLGKKGNDNSFEESEKDRRRHGEAKEREAVKHQTIE
jgi:hypothetical protein